MPPKEVRDLINQRRRIIDKAHKILAETYPEAYHSILTKLIAEEEKKSKCPNG